jgi:hypothetical protein
MAASFARPSRAVTPPKPRSGLRRGRKGVDGEDLGRATIGLATIGSRSCVDRLVPEFVLQLLARHQQGSHLLRSG